MIIITCDLLIDSTLPCEPGAGIPAEQLHGQQARPAVSEDRHRDLRQGQVVPALLQVLRCPQGPHPAWSGCFGGFSWFSGCLAGSVGCFFCAGSVGFLAASVGLAGSVVV